MGAAQLSHITQTAEHNSYNDYVERGHKPEFKEMSICHAKGQMLRRDHRVWD